MELMETARMIASDSKVYAAELIARGLMEGDQEKQVAGYSEANAISAACDYLGVYGREREYVRMAVAQDDPGAAVKRDVRQLRSMA